MSLDFSKLPFEQLKILADKVQAAKWDYMVKYCETVSMPSIEQRGYWIDFTGREYEDEANSYIYDVMMGKGYRYCTLKVPVLIYRRWTPDEIITFNFDKCPQLLKFGNELPKTIHTECGCQGPDKDICNGDGFINVYVKKEEDLPEELKIYQTR